MQYVIKKKEKENYQGNTKMPHIEIYSFLLSHQTRSFLY
jgi:hypothetical protein